jgi:hypothetical protein
VKLSAKLCDTLCTKLKYSVKLCAKLCDTLCPKKTNNENLKYPRESF